MPLSVRSFFQVDAKYELIKPIGHGAYGVVISALNTETGQKVAIKKITRAFDDLVDAKRILREITLLRKFDHENVSFTSPLPLFCLIRWYIRRKHYTYIPGTYQCLVCLTYVPGVACRRAPCPETTIVHFVDALSVHQPPHTPRVQ